MSLSPIQMEKVSAVPLWQRWLSPHELVRDKERAGEIQILDTQLFAEEISTIYSGKQTKSDQRAALLSLSKVKLSEGRKALEAGLMRDRDGAVYVGAHAILIDQLLAGLLLLPKIMYLQPKLGLRLWLLVDMAVVSWLRSAILTFCL